MSPRNVIVFGPTGGVGSATARAAHSVGARVFLAMRDTSKSIPGLTAAEEQSGRYERVQADLTQPDSVHAAVTKTGATHAFIYATVGASPDHMRASAEALKAAGIEFVVILSSIAVQGDTRAVEPSDFIAFAHAQVEVSLQEVFGPQGYVAVRPAFFASNTLWWARQIAEDGEVKWPFPELKFDYISPDDIGAVSGAILAGAVEGRELNNAIELTGPEDMSVADAVGVIGQVVKKEVKLTKVSPEEGVQVMVSKSGLPEQIAKFLLEQFAKADAHNGAFESVAPEETKANIERYSKRPAMRFSQWVELNKAKFGA